ncbi:hypothetical protein M0Q97_07490 [Candidatus Dojkabacteria bacterium]|jgi:hypothetical protein|nr:hypothetical protein [Candidatus Dojkabacteria bacterium]
MDEDFKNIILEMSNEFDEEKGWITSEISVHKDLIPNISIFVKENTNIKYGKWILMECDTCVKYHGNGYIHASIEKFDSIEKMKNASNFIKIL